MSTSTEVQSSTNPITTTANAEKGSAMSQSTEVQSNPITTTNTNTANAEKANTMSQTSDVPSIAVTPTTNPANAEKGNPMSLPTEVQFNPNVELTDADNNLLAHGGALSVSVAEVGGDDPQGLSTGESLDRGAAKMEGSTVRLFALEAELARYKERREEEVPIIREAAFGVAKGIRFMDRFVASQLPLQSNYEKADPVFFIDRCLIPMEHDPVKFRSCIDMFQVLRAEFVGIEAAIRRLERDVAGARKQYKIDRTDFQKVIKEATSYVLKHAADGSEALRRIKPKGGRKPGTKNGKGKDKTVSTTPVPGTEVTPTASTPAASTPAATPAAPAPVAPIAPPQPVAAPAANDAAQIKIA